MQNWDSTYSVDEFPPSKRFVGLSIDPESNGYIPYKKLDTQPLIKAFVNTFEELFLYLSINKVWLFYIKNHQNLQLGSKITNINLTLPIYEKVVGWKSAY